MILSSTDTCLEDTIKEINSGYPSAIFLSQDEILLVEGYTDKKFYQRFTNLSVIAVNELKNSYPEKHATDGSCRQIIIQSIQNQKTNSIFHWYGIMDADYEYTRPTIPTNLTENLIFTNENSLETMLVNCAGVENFEKFVQKKIYWNLIKNYCLTNSIVELAIEYSFRIGCLRAKNDKLNLGLNFSGINNYCEYLHYSTPEQKIVNGKEKYTYGITFDFEDYKKKLIEISNVNSFSKIGLENVGEVSFSIQTSPWQKFCQGHDICNFIGAMNSLNKEISKNKKKIPSNKAFENILVEKFPEKYFKDSCLEKWLSAKNTSNPI